MLERALDDRLVVASKFVVINSLKGMVTEMAEGIREWKWLKRTVRESAVTFKKRASF